MSYTSTHHNIIICCVAEAYTSIVGIILYTVPIIIYTYERKKR